MNQLDPNFVLSNHIEAGLWIAIAVGFLIATIKLHGAVRKDALIATVDLRDFFESTRAARVRRCFVEHGWRDESLQALMRLCVFRDGLPQGAPTSPRLSNLVNYRLDRRIAAMAKKLGALYTRYADDITLSFRKDERDRVRYFIRFVRRAN